MIEGISRRAVISGTLACLLAPLDLEPRRRVWALGGLAGPTRAEVLARMRRVTLPSEIIDVTSYGSPGAFREWKAVLVPSAVEAERIMAQWINTTATDSAR
jgi:hypothetical protein